MGILHRTSILGTACTFILTASVSADFYEWEWEVGDPGSYGTNNNGGTFESIYSVYDPSSKELTWTMQFSDAVTEGFTLALNNGPNTKGHAGELALLYVDLTENPGDVVVSAYGYNGKNSANSWKDGDGDTGGNQAPDLILSSLVDGSFLMNSSIANRGSGLEISFTIDTSAINGHSPLYPDPNNDPWFGIGFGVDTNELGLWMHPYKNWDATYGLDGSIESLSLGGEGWFDGTGFDAPLVPGPGGLALLSVIPAVAGRGRRREIRG